MTQAEVQSSNQELATPLPLRDMQISRLAELWELREAGREDELAEEWAEMILDELSRYVSSHFLAGGVDIRVEYAYTCEEHGVSPEREVIRLKLNSATRVGKQVTLAELVGDRDTFYLSILERVGKEMRGLGYDVEEAYPDSNRYGIHISWDEDEYLEACWALSDASQIDALEAGVPLSDVFA